MPRQEAGCFTAPWSACAGASRGMPWHGWNKVSQSADGLLIQGDYLDPESDTRPAEDFEASRSSLREITGQVKSQRGLLSVGAAGLCVLAAAVLICSPSCREGALAQGKAALQMMQGRSLHLANDKDLAMKAETKHEVQLVNSSVYPEGPDNVAACGLVDEDTDYVMVSQAWFDHVDHVSSQEACCDLCRGEEQCAAWTWVKDGGLKSGNPGQCWRKGGQVGRKSGKVGVVSGFRHPLVKGKEEKKATDKKEEKEEKKGPVHAPKAETHDAPKKVDVKANETEKGNKTKKEKPIACAKTGASCLASKCCEEKGLQCYTKDKYWGQCMEDCIPGPNPLDPVSPLPWECKALGERTPGRPKQCSKAGEDCSKSKCCVEGGTLCYEKNETWAECKASCTPGPDMTDLQGWSPWNCEELGTRTPGPAPWVATKCAASNMDCTAAQCCADPGLRCYKKQPGWSQCRQSCTPGVKVNAWEPAWYCTPIGSRTPQAANAGAPVKTVAPWVVDHCKIEGQDCTKAKCCHAVGASCYMKNEYWGTCKTSCSTEPDPNDNNVTWSCETLGPKSNGLAIKGWPSLYCFSLYMPSRYEGDLMREMLKAGAGIFACDGYDVLSQENDTLGVDFNGNTVKALHVPMIKVGVSQDGTAGNAKLFMAVWDKLIAGGRHRDYDWTIKVDPDAVIIPWRVRIHMQPHTGENVYVVNCNKFPGSPNFPMMYGAVEIFSNKAMIAYAWGSWKCGQKLPWAGWGEDYYMTHCLDFLGVGRISDFGSLGDNLCTGAHCEDTNVASFHPFKDVGSWFKCWKTAVPQ